MSPITTQRHSTVTETAYSLQSRIAAETGFRVENISLLETIRENGGWFSWALFEVRGRMFSIDLFTGEWNEVTDD